MRKSLLAGPARRAVGMGSALVLVAGTMMLSAAPASASTTDSWESVNGVYHYFTVPQSATASGVCGNSTGAGSELEGNIGPAGTWAAVGLDASGSNCQANIGPMEPGVYTYKYVSTMEDRTKVAFRNPDSPVQVTSDPDLNVLFVPGDDVAWMADVADGGTVAEITAGDQPAMVWTPPSYVANAEDPTPVLYLLADSGQSYKEWLELGRAQQILDNLALDAVWQDMIVVMVDPGEGDAASVVDAVVPAIDAAYTTVQAPAGRAIAGIGRGAEQALGLAMSHPGFFGSVGSFSGYLPDGTVIDDTVAATLNASDLVRFYVGNTLDANYNNTYDAMQAIDGAGVVYQFDGVYPERGGVWDTWRLNLKDFASRVFQGPISDTGMSPGNRALTSAYVPPATGSITTPFIDENGMVTFETGTQWADAKDVVLWGDWAPNGQWFRIPLQKEGDRWRTTIGPIDGYYYWRYEVDGTGYPDPARPAGLVNAESQLYVPGGVRTPLLADVPADEQGKVDVVSYDSAYTGADAISKMKVWMPPDYDPNRVRPYPVMYLYHGFGQNYASWTETGAADKILDNMYAQGLIEPMLVVMPGYPGASDFWVDLSTKVMPYIQSHYNAGDTADYQGLAGLSWGGRGTTDVMMNPDRMTQFAYYGVFSPPMAMSGLNDTTGAIAHDTFKWVTLMSGDVDTGAVGANEFVAAQLQDYGVPYENLVIPGPHGFDVWWEGLIEFLPHLFTGVDASYLQAEVDETAKLTADDFLNPVDWRMLSTALTDAQAVLADAEASQGDIDQALDALVEVKERLYMTLAVFGSQPVLSGEAKVGSTLTVAVDSPSVAADFEYQWFRGQQILGGVTGPSYQLTAADAGQDISVKVLLSRQGSGTLYRYTNHVIVDRIITVTEKMLPTNAEVGDTLDLALTFEPSDAAVSIMWFRGTTLITEDCGASYTLTDADAGAVIKAKIVISKDGYETVTHYSNGTIVAGVQPTVLRSATLTQFWGNMLFVTAETSGTAPETTTYTWFNGTSLLRSADGTPVTGPMYTPTADDAGKDISVKVTVTGTGIDTVTKYTNHYIVPTPEA
ncbi:MAG: hypothetical protein LBM23_06210 [Propionibacteriaceae bacterium]|jgi:enterochelin esterase-like enzyme|nr:hypothetical protein [Propionibacteriaceae bacterium]